MTVFSPLFQRGLICFVPAEFLVSLSKGQGTSESEAATEEIAVVFPKEAGVLAERSLF
jgi:hypothetical protein